jgi:hypothetical protein
VANGDDRSKGLVYRRGDTTVSIQVPPGRVGVNIVNVRAGAPDRR